MADHKAHDDAQEKKHLKQDEKEQASELSATTAPVVFETIRQMGEHELSRPWVSLWWSGVAAGFGISTAVLCKGFFEALLPKADWTPIISNIGYSVGFLVVILGRMQLFTENTITPILPVLYEPTREKFFKTARLWGIVFAANMVGCLVAAFCIARLGIIPEKQMEGILAISRHYGHLTFEQHLLWGAPAGFMIAALVWMLPSAEGAAKLAAIMIMTYMIGLGGFSHVVAGSTELYILAWKGEIGFAQAFLTGVLPAAIGNIIGGTGLFTTLAYGQVKEEV